MLIISTGGVEANRTLLDEHQLACPVLLQQEMEVATVYKAHGVPSGYLVDAEGRIASELAIGAETLLTLASGTQPQPSTLNSQTTQSGNGDGHEHRFKEQFAGPEQNQTARPESRHARPGFQPATVGRTRGAGAERPARPAGAVGLLQPELWPVRHARAAT